LKHPAFELALDAVMNSLQHAGDTKLIFVVGPTGVGKTTLLQILQRSPASFGDATQGQSDQERIPVMHVPVSLSSDIDWQDYMHESLVALGVSVSENVATGQTNNPHDTVFAGVKRLSTPRAADLRRALCQCLRDRHPQMMGVDEAQHLCIGNHHGRPNPVEVIGEIADTTNVVHLLIGTYDTLPLVAAAAQFGRKHTAIHFGRYHADAAGEWASFKDVLHTLQVRTPFAESMDFVQMADYFYAGCLGCIGILTDWIDRSINAANSNRKSRLTRKDVELSALSVYQRYMLAKEMKQGEDDWHNQFVHIQDAGEVLLMAKNGY
jgi:hypothetical protein